MWSLHLPECVTWSVGSTWNKFKHVTQQTSFKRICCFGFFLPSKRIRILYYPQPSASWIWNLLLSTSNPPPLPLSSFRSLLQFPNRRSTFSERYTCYHNECRTLLTTVSPRRALRLDAFTGQLRSWCNTYEVLENKYFLPITLQFNTTNNVF